VPARKLSFSYIVVLGPFFSFIDLDYARLHIGEVPWWLLSEKEAVTVKNDIYFRDPNQRFETIDEFRFLAHELQHVKQWREGMTTVGYFWSCVKGWGYNGSVYELDACDKANEVLWTYSQVEQNFSSIISWFSWFLPTKPNSNNGEAWVF
jgi:hypothetical protein